MENQNEQPGSRGNQIAPTLPAAPEGEAILGGKYRILRVIKRARTDTLLGEEIATHRPVVVKKVATQTLSVAARMRIEFELSVLQRLKDPAFAPLLELGHDDTFTYLVTGHLPGIALAQRLRSARLSVSESLTVGVALMQALQTAHELGVLHRRVSPAHVVVNDLGPVVHASVIDFGWGLDFQSDAAAATAQVDEVRYLAPEQAGLISLTIDECADLYSSGVVLFECLAGYPPFRGQTVGELLRQHMTVNPPALSSLGLVVPRAIDEVIRRLLRKDPRDRYQTASAVLADLQAISEAMNRGVAEPAIVIGLQDRRRTLAEPAFVGRGDELATLEPLLELARGGRGDLVLVEAESGGGKTRLLSEFAQRCAGQGAWVLEGQGLDRVGQQPLQLLAGIAAGIVAAARGQSEYATELQKRLGDQFEAVCAALPLLAEGLAWKRSSVAGPAAFGEVRTLQAISALLDSLGTEERPAVVLLDDCQWADELTLRILAHWQKRGPEGSPRQVLLVATFRTEETPPEHPLRSLRPAAHLTLLPFQPADIRQLCESMAGRLPDRAIQVVERLSEGSPFMASAVLRGMVEAGALVAERTGWRVEPAAMDRVQSSRHAAGFLAERIELLPPLAIELLTAGAVLGKGFDLELAAKLVRISPREAMAGITEACKRRIVWVESATTRYLFVHDKIREAVLRRLAAERRQNLHRSAAQLIQSQHPDQVFDLAYHFDAAGESTRALPFALLAAERARQQHSLEIAEQQYRIAQRGVPIADIEARYKIAEGLGDVLLLRGRYDAAAQSLEIARPLAQGNELRAEIAGKLGELAFKRGDMKSAAVALEQALQLLGRKVPLSATGFVTMLGWEAMVQTLHTLVPRLLVGRKELRGAEHDLLAMRLFSRLAHAYWFVRGKIPSLATHLRGMNLAERYPPTPELGQAYSEHAPGMSLIPYFHRGIIYAEKSLEIRKSLGDVWGQGQSLHYHGIILYAASRFRECIRMCRQAVRLLEQTGDFWEMHIARYQIAASLYRQGDLHAAVAEAKAIHRSGIELGDAQASGISLDIWALASGGNIPAETVKAELERPRGDAQADAQVGVAEGVWLLSAGRPAEAAAALERALEVVRQAGIRNAWVAPIYPWLATALREQAVQTNDFTPQGRAELLRRAAAAVRQGLSIARHYQNDLPHVLREQGLLAAARGQSRAARRAFDKSLRIAERQGARYEHAKSLLARGQVGRELGWPGADEQIVAARDALRLLAGADATPVAHPVQVATLSLADRFDTVLQAGRQIASGLSRETIFASVRDAALRLLRAEDCLILKLELTPSSEQITLILGDPDETFSRDLVREAVQSGRSIAAEEEVSQSTSESVVLHGVRSSLCAPIFVRGQAAACFYVFHRQIASLFGPDEERLAEFIAAIAGAALENAAGFAALQELNTSLEQRVADRTADLEARSKDLARSNEDLAQFAYVASHDLQEPLRTVADFCKLLKDRCRGKLDSEAEDYIARALDGAGRMKVLISDLLTYSRVGTRGKPFEPVDLAQILNSALANLKVAIEERGAIVTHDPLPVLMADSGQLTQLFQNLIGNALKFQRPGQQPAVHIGAQRIEDDWQLSVRDNGIGIEPVFFDKIFLIFQRLHTRKEYSGTGIGLAICKKTVERHNGRIWVESQPGQGSTFFFAIPIKNSAES